MSEWRFAKGRMESWPLRGTKEPRSPPVTRRCTRVKSRVESEGWPREREKEEKPWPCSPLDNFQSSFPLSVAAGGRRGGLQAT